MEWLVGGARERGECRWNGVRGWWGRGGGGGLQVTIPSECSRASIQQASLPVVACDP